MDRTQRRRDAGVNRGISASGNTSVQFPRSAQTANGISHFADHQSRPATEFKLKELVGKKVVFENPAHDFPQQISYWLADEGALHARRIGQDRRQERCIQWRWDKQNSP